MIRKMNLTHFLSKEAFETVLKRLDPAKAAKSAKHSLAFLYENGQVTEIELRETDVSKPIHTYVMQAALDCTQAMLETAFYTWVTGLYQDKFAVADIEDFPAYDQFICDYAEYEQILPVEDADKTIVKLLKSEKWLPAQLNRSLWENHKMKNGYAWYGAKEDNARFILRICCGAPFLRKKCRDALGIRAHGVAPEFILDPHTEETIMHLGKTAVYETNRVNRSPYAPGDMIRVLSGGNAAAAAALIATAEKHDLKPEMTYTPEHKHWKCVYFLKKPKQKIFTVWTSPEEFRIKANLFKIDEYLPTCTLTETVKHQLLSNTMDCADCENQRCSGAKITLDGKTYRRCIYGAFTFGGLSAADYDVLIGLIVKEIAAAN